MEKTESIGNYLIHNPIKIHFRSSFQFLLFLYISRNFRSENLVKKQAMFLDYHSSAWYCKFSVKRTSETQKLEHHEIHILLHPFTLSKLFLLPNLLNTLLNYKDKTHTSRLIHLDKGSWFEWKDGQLQRSLSLKRNIHVFPTTLLKRINSARDQDCAFKMQLSIIAHHWFTCFTLSARG